MVGTTKLSNAVSLKKAIFILWCLWFAAVVGCYYKQLWNTLFLLVQTRSIPAEARTTVWEIGKALFSFFLVVLPLYGLYRFLKASPNNSQRRFKKAAGIAVLLLAVTAVLLAGSKLPHFWPAFSRAAIGLAGAGAVILAAAFLGKAIFRLLNWQFDNWREQVLFQTTTGLIVLANCSLLLAGLGLYFGISVQLLVFLILLAGLFRHFKNYKRNKSSLAKEEYRFFFPERPYSTQEKLLVFITLLALSIAFIAALAPETEFDALSYHLTFPKMWLEQGFLVDLSNRYVSLYPMSWGLLFGNGMALGGTIAAKLLHFACLPLNCLLVYQFVKRFLPQASGWLAVAFFITVPSILWEATTAYIDLALALHLGLAVYALLCYAEKKQQQWLVLAAINIGMSLASKHLALFFLALTATGLFLLLWLQHRNLKKALIPAVIFGCISLLLPAPWYVRSFLATGNPVFPELFHLFGAPAHRWDAYTQQGLNQFLQKLGPARTPENLLKLPWDMTIHAARFDGVLGPVFLLLLVPLLWLRRLSRNVLFLLLFSICYLLLWASPFSSFQMRFLLPIVPLLALLAAEMYRVLEAQAAAVSEGARKVLFFLISGILVFNLPPFIFFHEGDRVNWKGWLVHVLREQPLAVVTGKEGQEQYLGRMVPAYKAWQYINKNLDTTAYVLSFSDGDYFYSQRNRLWSEAAIARPAVWGAMAGQEKEAAAVLQQLGISHILFNKEALRSSPSGQLALAQPAFLQQCRLEYEDFRFVLYRFK